MRKGTRGMMRKGFFSLYGLIVLAGCAGPVSIVYDGTTYVNKDGSGTISRKDQEILPGIPFPEMKVVTVNGILTWHSKLGAKCDPTPAERKEVMPTGKMLYIKAGGNFFTSKKINVSFHANGYLASIGGENSSTSSGVSGFVKDIVSSVSSAIAAGVDDDDVVIYCDMIFVPIENVPNNS